MNLIDKIVGNFIKDDNHALSIVVKSGFMLAKTEGIKIPIPDRENNGNPPLLLLSVVGVGMLLVFGLVATLLFALTTSQKIILFISLAFVIFLMLYLIRKANGSAVNIVRNRLGEKDDLDTIKIAQIYYLNSLHKQDDIFSHIKKYYFHEHG